MKLIWDSSQFKVQLNNTDIYIAPENCPPFLIQALVEEQDTSLILHPSDTIPEYKDSRPSWYLANTQELQNVYNTGEVIVKSTNPIRLLSVVYDLDCECICHLRWIKIALNNIFKICQNRSITSLGLPVLGALHGNIDAQTFVDLLAEKIQHKESECPQQLWLIVPVEQCQLVYAYIKQL